SQANESKVKRDLGSGVGLALCKMIAEGHNGCVDFVSQYKKGSTFVFKIPLSLKIMQKNRELN
ncbi:ATP-binding protein, partial [bacterium]|nr:ATP-binding protein [bacterium]